MNYPARGETSADGKWYTHTDGTVHEKVPYIDNVHVCDDCSVVDLIGMVTMAGCLLNDMQNKCQYRKVEGAYVPSAEETAACDMARAMIAQCGNVGYFKRCTHDANMKCARILDKSCPARAYLFAHGVTAAWEVTA